MVCLLVQIYFNMLIYVMEWVGKLGSRGRELSDELVLPAHTGFQKSLEQK